jgi:hypothetical protein
MILDLTRQAIYVQRNIRARSCNHCYSGKAISITYCEFMSIALGILREMCMLHTVIRRLSGSTVFFHIISEKARFSKKKKMFLYIKCVLIFSTTFLWNISHYTEWAKSRYTVGVQNFFFFTGIVNDGTELKYRTKKVDFEAVLENWKCQARTINIILYTQYENR